MFIWIIPANSVVMWVRMLISTVVICLMPFHFRPPIRPHFCLVNITVIHYRSFDFSGISQIALILRLIGIWSPFSTISASAAFTDHVCVHCITKRVICATNFIAVQIFMGHCLLVIVHVPPGAAFIIHIEVHQAEKINGEWVQKLTIYYNCVGALFIPDTPSMPVPDVTVNTRRGVYVSYEPAQNRQ